jgi:uncharacterized membrane protein YhaH (DUF805 family)
MANSYTSNEFLFSFRGRINRAKYWYAGFASSAFCSVLLGLVAFALGRIFGARIKSVHLNFFDIAPFNIAFSDAGPASTKTLTLFYAAGAPIVAFGMWFLAAATVKRLHDRDKSGWWIVPLFIASGIFTRLERQLPDSAMALLGLVAFALWLWGFVELLCLRGTHGPNRFGPYPLPKEQTRPRSERQTVPRTSGWDQFGELEMLPHTASPPPLSHVKRGHD